MTPDILFVFSVLAVAVVLFASGRLRSDVVALLVIIALVLGGILPVAAAVAGFGDSVVAASAAFATPVSSPVNTLVLAPGGYRFNDFVRVGTPLILVMLTITLLVVPLLLPL